MPKLRVSCGAFVSIQVVVEVPMLPLAVVRVTLPVVLVLIVSVAAAATILPVFVVRFTDCRDVLPMVAPIVVLKVPPPLFTVKFCKRLVTLLMLIVYPEL